MAEVGSILRADNRTAGLLCELRKWRRISAGRGLMLSMEPEGWESNGQNDFVHIACISGYISTFESCDTPVIKLATAIFTCFKWLIRVAMVLPRWREQEWCNEQRLTQLGSGFETAAFPVMSTLVEF